MAGPTREAFGFVDESRSPGWILYGGTLAGAEEEDGGRAAAAAAAAENRTDNLIPEAGEKQRRGHRRM